MALLSETNAGLLPDDRIDPARAENWLSNFDQESSMNLEVSQYLLQKTTYDILSGGNVNRIRIKPGIELVDGKPFICIFAIGASPCTDCSSGYEDIPVPVYKLTPENQDYSNRIEEVKAAVELWKSWWLGEILPGTDAAFRKYIYLISALLSEKAMNRIFNELSKESAEIFFGIEKTLRPVIFSEVLESGDIKGGETEIFDYSTLCPPLCGGDDILDTPG